MGASLTKLMAGTSTKYYTQTVEDVATDHGGGMAGYYNTPGTPPGMWMGRGLDVIHRQAGFNATKPDISRVYDNLCDPDTGRSLSRIGRKSIEAGEAVAGYDLTFTLPKSVDILWAAGDPYVRRTIMRCHKEAVKESIDWFESREAYSRTGKDGIVKRHAAGIIAADFTHWDSRDGDPHLHDHVLISNIIKRADGSTGTLDGKALYRAAVAISERHTNLFMDKMTESLGVQWRQREMPGTKSCVYDLAGIDDQLIDAFSRRNAEINQRLSKEVDQLRADGIEPTPSMLQKLHQRAWRLSRKAKPKEPKSLHELMDEWNEELVTLGYDPQRIVQDTIGRGGLNMDIKALLEQPHIMEQARRIIEQGEAAGAQQEPAAWLATLLRSSIADTAALQSMQRDSKWELGGRKDPFTAMHQETAYNTTTISENMIRSAAERLTRGIRLKEGQRDQLTDLLVEEEKKNLVLIDPGKYSLSDDQLRDTDIAVNKDRAVTDDPEGHVYATKELLAAEQRFKMHAKAGVYKLPTGWNESMLAKAVQEAQSDRRRYKHPLAPDQKKAVVGLLSSTKTIVALSGPAGTGKTTTLRCLADVASRNGGRQVVAFAPTAVAAQELGASLGVPADTLAKLLYEDRHGRLDERISAAEAEYRSLGAMDWKSLIRLNPRNTISRYRQRERARQRLAGLQAEKRNLTIPENGIVIVDEAGMANTFDLQQLSELCDIRHAKMILVGDDKQLNTVGGGAGAFAWVAQQKNMACKLESIWRFKNENEASLSRLLRSGSQDETTKDFYALHSYDAEGRIHAGQADAIEESLIRKVANDYDSGVSSLLIVGSNEGISDMNERISRQRQASGSVESDPRRRIILSDGSTAGKGDIICTRTNDRRIRTSQGGYVRNNDLWTVDETSGGAIRCHPADREGDSVILPASYVDRNVIGGYAVTPHRSQGKTVDRGYYYIPQGQEGISSANTLYVAMTRGREGNDVYVATKDIKEMMVGTEDTYELAAWKLRNKSRYEKVEHRRFWDEQNGPKPGKEWYTAEELLPTPHQQAMFTLHKVMEHTQTGRLASEWARQYRQASYSGERLQTEWNTYRRILSGRQLGDVLDEGDLARLKDDPGYGTMLDAYAQAREDMGPRKADHIAKTSEHGEAIGIANMLSPGAADHSEARPHLILDKGAPPDQARVIDLMNQTCRLYKNSWMLSRSKPDLSEAFAGDYALWSEEALGPEPPLGSPRVREYTRISGEIIEYRAVHRITDPRRPFGASGDTDGWQRDIRRKIANYRRRPPDPDALTARQDPPRRIAHGTEMAVKAGRGIILDYTGGRGPSGKTRIPVDARNVNGTIRRIRDIRPDAPARIIVKARPGADLTGVWRALTPAERGRMRFLGEDGSMKPLWQEMMEGSAESGRAGSILQGLDIEHRRQAESWLKKSSPSSQGESYAPPSGPAPLSKPGIDSPGIS